MIQTIFLTITIRFPENVLDNFSHKDCDGNQANSLPVRSWKPLLKREVASQSGLKATSLNTAPEEGGYASI